MNGEVNGNVFGRLGEIAGYTYYSSTKFKLERCRLGIEMYKDAKTLLILFLFFKNAISNFLTTIN